ncbi:LPS-assembly protein LptD, partial [candidate division KSB1 bacterium]
MMIRSALHKLFLFAIILLAAVLTWAQEQATPAAPAIQPSDTLTTDSLRTDSLAADTVKKKGGDADTLVTYSASEIDFDVVRRVSVLTGAAVITYKDMRLDAERIEVDWDRQVLTATGMTDTMYKDSLMTEMDTILVKGRPHFLQGKDEFYGDEIAYNLKTKVGRVRGGTTQYEDGYYYGEQFKRVDEDVITVKGGNFTTCDEDTPHYHFAAKELKVIVGKRVIARPVILCFEDVPVLAAPYGVFP